jgi:hypothetical protein
MRTLEAAIADYRFNPSAPAAQRQPIQSASRAPRRQSAVGSPPRYGRVAGASSKTSRDFPGGGGNASEGTGSHGARAPGARIEVVGSGESGIEPVSPPRPPRGARHSASGPVRGSAAARPGSIEESSGTARVFTVADATPLIALARIERLDLLLSLYGTITVPRALLLSVSFGRIFIRQESERSSLTNGPIVLNCLPYFVRCHAWMPQGP